MGKREALTDPVLPRPFLKWVGGKRQLMDALHRRLPAEIDTYYEPFVGGGALMWSLVGFKRPRRVVINDANGELINAYRVVRDEVEALIADLGSHINEASYFYALRAVDRTPAIESLSPVARASRLIYLNKTAYNGLYRVNARGHFNAPFGRYARPNILDAENLRACARVLRDVDIAEGDFAQVLAGARSGDFVYFDPPYVPVSKTACFTAYTRQGFSDDMQARLAAVCRQLDASGVRFLLSNSATPELRALYAGFEIEAVEARRAVNSRASGRGGVTEFLIRNY